METNLEWRSSQCDRLRRRFVLDVENVRDGSFTESREVETDPHRLKDRSKPDFNPVIQRTMQTPRLLWQRCDEITRAEYLREYFRK